MLILGGGGSSPSNEARIPKIIFIFISTSNLLRHELLFTGFTQTWQKFFSIFGTNLRGLPNRERQKKVREKRSMVRKRVKRSGKNSMETRGKGKETNKKEKRKKYAGKIKKIQGTKKQ